MSWGRKWRVGDIIRISLPCGRKSYARLREFPLMSFYDYRTEVELTSKEIVRLPVAFTIWVHKSATKSPNWEAISNEPLSGDMTVQPVFFKRDRISGEYSHYLGQGEERPATFDACLGLERAAVWDPEHVESRLIDHIEGRPNKWVEMMRPDRR